VQHLPAVAAASVVAVVDLAQQNPLLLD